MTAPVALGDTDIWCACPGCGLYEHHLIAARPREVREVGDQAVSIVNGAGETVRTYNPGIIPAHYRRECRTCGHVWTRRPGAPPAPAAALPLERPTDAFGAELRRHLLRPLGT